MRSEDEGRALFGPEWRPQVARGITAALDANLRQQSVEELAGGPPLLAPANSPRAAGSAGPPVELAEVRDHPGGVDRRPAHEPNRSLRSAWARQCAPPPPSVNIDRSSSQTVRPCARIGAFSDSAAAIDST